MYRWRSNTLIPPGNYTVTALGKVRNPGGVPGTLYYELNDTVIITITESEGWIKKQSSVTLSNSTPIKIRINVGGWTCVFCDCGDGGITDFIFIRKYTSPEPSPSTTFQEQNKENFKVPQTSYTLSLILKNPSSVNLQNIKTAIIYPNNTKEIKTFPNTTINKGELKILTIQNLSQKPQKIIVSAQNCPVQAEKEVE